MIYHIRHIIGFLQLWWHFRKDAWNYGWWGEREVLEVHEPSLRVTSFLDWPGSVTSSSSAGTHWVWVSDGVRGECA